MDGSVCYFGACARQSSDRDNSQASRIWRAVKPQADKHQWRQNESPENSKIGRPLTAQQYLICYERIECDTESDRCALWQGYLMKCRCADFLLRCCCAHFLAWMLTNDLMCVPEVFDCTPVTAKNGRPRTYGMLSCAPLPLLFVCSCTDNRLSVFECCQSWDPR